MQFLAIVQHGKAARNGSELMMRSNLELGVVLRVNYCTREREIAPVPQFSEWITT
jgi:hypothetical protein